jgi:hypothetical protein
MIISRRGHDAIRPASRDRPTQTAEVGSTLITFSEQCRMGHCYGKHGRPDLVISLLQHNDGGPVRLDAGDRCPPTSAGSNP